MLVFHYTYFTKESLNHTKMNRLNQDPVYFDCIKMIDNLVQSLVTFSEDHKEAIRGINFKWIDKYKYISESYHTQKFTIDEALSFIELIETNCNAYLLKLVTQESIDSLKQIIVSILDYKDKLNSYYM